MDKVVRIDWIDTNGSGRWTDREWAMEKVRPTLCRSYGAIIDETPEYITLAGSLDGGNDNVDHVTSIPRTAIKKITKLVEKKK
jgi:hypothetical protein